MFDTDQKAIDFLVSKEWTLSSQFNFFSPRPYGQCSHEEKSAILYLLNEHDFSYGGHIG